MDTPFRPTFRPPRVPRRRSARMASGAARPPIARRKGSRQAPHGGGDAGGEARSPSPAADHRRPTSWRRWIQIGGAGEVAGMGDGGGGAWPSPWRWTTLAATVWIQAFTGTNFDFPAYSSDLKSAMGISQIQLGYLATASDLGKALGWSSGIALLYLPLPAVLLLAAALGLLSYAAQWLVITSRISLPYLAIFVLCLVAGCSICWFNTVCFTLCIRNFPTTSSLALSLTISFNGVSAALYTLFANAISGASSSIYLLLNATLPFLVAAVALFSILRQPHAGGGQFAPLFSRSVEERREPRAFLFLNAVAFVTGLYLLLLNSASSDPSVARTLLAGAVLLLLLPLLVPALVLRPPNDNRVGDDDEEAIEPIRRRIAGAEEDCAGVMAELAEEHGVGMLLRRTEFWLYYASYLCGATLGIVYSNNIGQIAQSLGKESETAELVAVYSACSFFGRLASALPEYYSKASPARTGWLAAALAPMSLAFFMLAAGGGGALAAGTAMIGLSSGFIFAAAVSVTAELFGPKSSGVNHNILITNIPLGSTVYGLMASLVYEGNAGGGGGAGEVVCMGSACFTETFGWWGCISLLGLASSTALYLRTKMAYRRRRRHHLSDRQESAAAPLVGHPLQRLSTVNFDREEGSLAPCAAEH